MYDFKNNHKMNITAWKPIDSVDSVHKGEVQDRKQKEKIQGNFVLYETLKCIYYGMGKHRLKDWTFVFGLVVFIRANVRPVKNTQTSVIIMCTPVSNQPLNTQTRQTLQHIRLIFPFQSQQPKPSPCFFSSGEPMRFKEDWTELGRYNTV